MKTLLLINIRNPILWVDQGYSHVSNPMPGKVPAKIFRTVLLDILIAARETRAAEDQLLIRY
jgi:hypothetical protein